MRSLIRNVWLIRQLWQFVADSRTGDLSASKFWTMTFCMVMTLHMLGLIDGPDDPWLWFVYGALVGGFEVAKKAISARFSAPSSEPQS